MRIVMPPIAAGRSPTSAIAAAFRAFHPRRLRHCPVIFAATAAALMFGGLGLGALIAGAPGALPGLELSAIVGLITLAANFIEALANSDRQRKGGRR